MYSLKAIRTRHFNHSFPLIFSNLTNSSEFMDVSSISRRPFSHSAPNADETIRTSKEPLGGFFRRVIFGEERTESNRGVAENAEMEEGARSLGDKLRNLEDQVRDLNQKRCDTAKKLQLSSEKVDPVVKREKRSLSPLFNKKWGPSISKSESVAKSESKRVALVDHGMEDPMVHRELSPDMKIFAHHLYAKGYMKKANFLCKNKFDPTCFENGYAREFLKSAASNFGDNHRHIAGWLSAGDLKKIARFGCPNLGQKTVHAAKHMRRFFRIDEHKVCKACTLKKTCKHWNRIIKKQKKLNLGNVMKVVIMYAMNSVPQNLEVPQEIKDSASRVLKEIVSLTQKKS